MNKHLIKIWILVKAIGNQIYQWFMELPPYKRVVAVVGTIVIIVIAYRILPTTPKAEEAIEQPKYVEVKTVAELSNINSPLSLSGQVTSVNEATIRAESSGQLTRVYKKLGDFVYAGQVIAEFENSSERAGVLQAEGAYESAKASRDIAVINTGSTNLNITDIKTNTINTINSTFSTMDDIIRTKTDIAYENPRGESPRIKILMTDSLLQSKLERDRLQIEKMLVERFKTNMNLNQNSELILELQKLQNETQIIKTYLDDLGNAYNKSIADSNFSIGTIEQQKSQIGILRSTISGTISAISGAKVTLQNGLTSLEVAGRTTGDKSPNSASVDAQVKIALGSYNAALSRLDKTIIRSPINGTLNSLTIETGDFINQTSQVAVVSNNGSLEVVAYVTSDDGKRVNVGNTVKINSTIKGVVTRIASAIDPITKKIEIKIGIIDNKSELINGQSVKVEITEAKTSIVKTGANNTIKIPLSAVKITPRGSYVFILTASSTLQAVSVETGTLLGEEVQIVNGLTKEMEIIKDVRGLKEGEIVTTNSN